MVRPAPPRNHKPEPAQASSCATRVPMQFRDLEKSGRCWRSCRLWSTRNAPMTRSLIVIFSAIVLDAVRIRLIFPILPSLLRDISHAENVAPYIGTMTALYAMVQFIFAPVLGALSDRLGRR